MPEGKKSGSYSRSFISSYEVRKMGRWGGQEGGGDKVRKKEEEGEKGLEEETGYLS